MSERPDDKVFECLVEATGTWRSVANPRATGETALALEARRARTEESRLRAENEALRAIYLPLSVRHGGPEGLARYYRRTRDFIQGLQAQAAAKDVRIAELEAQLAETEEQQSEAADAWNAERDMREALDK